MEVLRSYHATAHAKGRQDGFGGVFKSMVRNAVDREDKLLNTPELIEKYMVVRKLSMSLLLSLVLSRVDGCSNQLSEM